MSAIIAIAMLRLRSTRLPVAITAFDRIRSAREPYESVGLRFGVAFSREFRQHFGMPPGSRALASRNHIDIGCVFSLHANDVIAGIHVMRFARHARGKI